MKNTIVIAKRELRERLKSRSFLLMALLGPIAVLSLLFILFTASGGEMQKVNVLVSDPIETLENIIVTDNDRQIEYAFINSYIEPEDFASSPDFKKFDALLVVNEKVLSNNHVFFFQKERLNPKIPLRVQRELEKRLEGLKAKEFTELTLEEFLIIKHPLSLEVRDALNPREKSNYKLASYAGFTFGLVIFIFVFLFGMTILRSTIREKSSRIAEVLLSMVRPSELMSGKIVGIGIAAFIQFTIWLTLVAFGLYIMRILYFPDMFAGATLVDHGDNFTPYNDAVRLVYEQLNFGVMILFFFLLLVLAYLFYAGLFAALGAAQGSESDGQQFLIPLIMLFFLACWSGWYVIENPNAELSFWLGIIPFTSPMVVMVKLAGGYGAGEIWHLLMAILLLLLSMIFTIRMAGRIFQRALLTTGYRLNLRIFLKWMFNN
jgi:ABC-2 type transport system permease protein